MNTNYTRSLWDSIQQSRLFTLETRLSGIIVPYGPMVSEQRSLELIELAKKDPRASIRETCSELGGAILGAANVQSGYTDPTSADIIFSLGVAIAGGQKPTLSKCSIGCRSVTLLAIRRNLSQQCARRRIPRFRKNRREGRYLINTLNILPMQTNQRTAFAEIWIPWLRDTMKRTAGITFSC